MSEPAEKPVCLVTGGTSGIGLATVRKFMSGNYRVATCGRNNDRVGELESEFVANRASILVEQLDLADIQKTLQFCESVLEKWGRIDVLINNAAAAPLAPFDAIENATFENCINVNIRSIFYLTQRVWKAMKEQGGGAIVNISSLAAVDPFPGFSLYGSSKAWLELVSQALAVEGQSLGIRTYSIRAGAVETPLLRGLFPDFPPAECVLPDEIAERVWECVSDPNRFQSGTAYEVAKQT